MWSSNMKPESKKLKENRELNLRKNFHRHRKWVTLTDKTFLVCCQRTIDLQTGRSTPHVYKLKHTEIAKKLRIFEPPQLHPYGR